MVFNVLKKKRNTQEQWLCPEWVMEQGHKDTESAPLGEWNSSPFSLWKIIQFHTSRLGGYFPLFPAPGVSLDPSAGLAFRCPFVTQRGESETLLPPYF